MRQADLGRAITYRRAAGPEDFAPTYELFLAAANDLRARSHRPRLDDTIARRTRALAFREHAWRNDVGGFWIAERNGERVGFAIATARPRFWHLNALHVMPEWQAMGIGRELLRRCLEYGRGPGVVSTVISEAAQPVSNALYARHGMYQWLPLLHVECGTFRSRLPPGRRAPAVSIGRSDEATLSVLDRIDAAVLGFTRSVDHRFWIGLPDQMLLLLLGTGDEPSSYAYISRFGGIGPCSVRSPRQWPLLLAQSIALAAEHGIDRVSLVVPGVASTALDYLLNRAAARYDVSMTLLLSSRPFGRLNRYLLPASDALF